MAKRIFITGAGGFIGRHLVQEIEKEGHEWRGIDSFSAPDSKIRSVSLLEYEKLKTEIAEYAPDVIIHLAAIALATYENVAEIYTVNVCGTENLLRAASQVCPKGTRVILISTAGVYGNQNKEFYEESLPYYPENHYSYSKMVAEMLSRHYDSLDIKIVRPFNIIGSGQRKVFLIPKLVEHFATKQKELHVGNLEPERDYVDIDYCTYILMQLAVREDAHHRVYNICSGVGTSVREVIDILTEYSGHCPEIIIDPKFVRKNEVWRMVGDPTKLLEFLGGIRCGSFEGIIKRMYDSYS